SLRPFYEQNYPFWQYYQMGHQHLDEHYFLRTPRVELLLLQEEDVHRDWQTNTLMSVVTARLHAYDLFKEHVADVMSRLLPVPDADKENASFTLIWTAPKALALE